jgi:pimeloyl-ACP methyl ester carboxylesterase
MRSLSSLLLLLILILPVQATEGVILLHGLCRTSASMNKMAATLTAAGYYVKNVAYPSRTAPIEKLSEDTITRALADPQLQTCAHIHFVTHSLGGLLVRSYYERHPPGKLGRVVMLGPPNQGSEVVDKLGNWWLFQKINGPAGCELGTSPDSTPNKLGPVNFELGVIAGDRSINWINSLMIKGKDDGKVSVARSQVQGMKDFHIVHVAHPFLMRNPQVIASTLRFLQSGHFTASVPKASA